ncbi:ATP-binding protein [Methanosarcina mazei]|uniref:ATP-binding protein n=1 Tax=Methanosarcina mazei TaxID=2209 RepID=A0A0F8TEX8_METMZ|nr:ATP-binding protein [Methanosarcina mazei]KKF99585.1 hypothetical protein DU31_10215 [Methanosarcina mazei]KKH34847.1 hypothetical protein DU54_10165 [Methanosarcina mazei]KKH39158.1 hypothetical protein DU50_11150 [Methanosarcina mazei]KKH50760.1 hypothetical protein DU85_06865 [Methanosarcina mazei]KKH54354.1 hypothetical protein DU76_16770 [Methanosarcina mazei]
MIEKDRILAIESHHLLHSLRASDFDIPSAIGELVDNSIQAGAKKIHLNIEDKSVGDRRPYRIIDKIICGDDGHGMDGAHKSILHSCIKLGYSTRFDERTGIGRFGVGMTLAGIRFATKIEVYSKQSGNAWNYVHFDLNDKDDLIDGIEAPIQKNIPEKYSSIVGKDQGTLVIWSGFDKFAEQDLHSTTYEDKFDIPDSLNPYGYLNHWIGRTYRKFIWDGIELFLNGQEIYSFDPLYINKNKNKFPEDDPAKLVYTDEIEWPIYKKLRKNLDVEETSKIKIKVSLLPEMYRQIIGRGGEDFKGRYIVENEGISILRSNREVLYETIPYFMKGGKKISWEDKDRWWGCEISFDPVLDEYFTVKNVKRGALPVKDLRDVLFEKMYGIRKQCIDDVQSYWKKYEKIKEKDKEKDKDGLPTTHKDAERIAIITKIPGEAKAGKDLPKEEEEAKIDEMITGLDEIEGAKWKAKFKAQPFTIKDEHWRGDTFIDMTYLEGNAVLHYNLNHAFFSEIDLIKKRLDESPESGELATRIKNLLDVLLMSFARARQEYPEEDTYTVKQILDYIVRDWGRYLENYTKAYIKETSGEE